MKIEAKERRLSQSSFSWSTFIWDDIFKGSSDPSHFIFEINVGRRRIWRVVLCRIRPFPTLTSKNNGLSLNYPFKISGFDKMRRCKNVIPTFGGKLVHSFLRPYELDDFISPVLWRNYQIFHILRLNSENFYFTECTLYMASLTVWFVRQGNGIR